MAGHALFPWEPHPDDDPGAEDPRDIGWIRIGRRAHKGEIEWVPQSFTADEIGDLDDVHANYGGGVYTFIARDQKNSRITARANDVLLPGPSKPLYTEPAETPPQAAAGVMPAAQSPALGVVAQVAAVAAALGPVLGPLFGYLTEGRREHQALMLELIGRSRSDQDGAARAAIEAASANQRVMADFFSKLSPGGGSGSLEQLLQAMQFGASMGNGGGQDDWMESLMAMLGPMLAQQGQGHHAPMLPPASPVEDEGIEVQG